MKGGWAMPVVMVDARAHELVDARESVAVLPTERIEAEITER